MIIRFLVLAAAVSAGVKTQTPGPNQGSWYENGVIYQIYPRSFQDTDGDGIGDLKGILQHVDYLGELGIDAVWLNPIYPSPNKDFGYDISNFTAIDPVYGTMDDFKNLLNALKAKGIKLIMDFVPNHTSDQHPWFKKSVQGDPFYKDYYVWLPPPSPKLSDKGHSVPNNWTSCFNGSMWEWNDQRKEFYLHQFLKYQPDLNFRNPNVLADMKKVLQFWMEQGVQGFRMDAVFALVENESWFDEPWNGGPAYAYNSYNHTMTTEQQETFEVLRHFREVLDEYKSRDNTTKIMMTESYNNEYSSIQKYFGSPDKPISTFPFNFFWILKGNLELTAEGWVSIINDWYTKAMPSGGWAQPNFVLGNHDQHRFASRLTQQHTDIMNILQLTLNGTAVVYFGDEIGLQDSKLRRDQGVDPVGTNSSAGEFLASSRDPQRAPMPWNDTLNGGFTNNSRPWLPLATSYWSVNVKEQQNSSIGHLQVFKDLAKLRKDHLVSTQCQVKAVGNAIAVFRDHADNPTYIGLINLSFGQETVDLTKARSTLPPQLQVKIKSVNYQMIEQANNKTNTVVSSNSIVLPPLAGLVLSSY